MSVFEYNVYGTFPPCFTSDLTEREVETVNTCLQTSTETVSWNSCESRIFEQLVFVEKEIGFDNLFALKNEIFVVYKNVTGAFLDPNTIYRPLQQAK